ncbi:excinuclease ABC subunit UvrA, partial [bacterium]|nr:excinuclease ABC subunit UvrA [bacterium]
GVITNLKRRYRQTESNYVREEIYNKYIRSHPCPTCHGSRLRKESLAITIGNKSILEVSSLSVKESTTFFQQLGLNQKEKTISHQILKEIKSRLSFLSNVGLDYITLNRQTYTLSGGEAQRIHLATSIGSNLVGVLYVLDEPSIGLHQRDNRRLLKTLEKLKNMGNTLIIVEHDEETIRHADYIVDLGPQAGTNGGEIICAGPLKKILNCEKSSTGQYLTGKLKIPIPIERRSIKNKNLLEIKKASQFNLKNIDVKIPLGVFTCITGVSGSGKSTLVQEIIYKALAQKIYKSKEKPGKFKEIIGTENIDKVIVVDQSPIGRTPRSNPATYTGLFTPIRTLFSQVPLAKMRGYMPGRFSFNVKGGRCSSCQGDGVIKIEMQFLPNVYVKCDECNGQRFNEETLRIKYKGKNISEVLEMSVKEALDFFRNIPQIKKLLQTLYDVGLGYIKLGQSSTTLSGGEAQRIKLAEQLSRRSTGKTFYILDEPTTGLHFTDIEKLLHVLHRLVNSGNTVLVIEHNLEVIKTADYIIDLGPEGGEKGGYIISQGPPEKIIKEKQSFTGQFLRKVLNSKSIFKK